MMQKSIRFAAAVAVGMALAACGSSSSGSDAADTGTGAGSKSVYAEYGQMSASERHDKLVELAKADGGKLTIYSDLTSLEPVVKAFNAKYGLKAESYLANSPDILAKVNQEEKANHPNADVVDVEWLFSSQADKAGYYTTDVKPAERHGIKELSAGWVPTRMLAYATLFNTKLIKPEDMPESIEELADPKWKGKVAMDLTDADWYRSALQYLQDKRGMSREQAVDTFKKIAKNTQFSKGHSTIGRILAGGEAAITPDGFVQTVTKLKPAPVDWVTSDGKVVAPIISSPCGAGLMKDAPHPAAAMLWLDWLLSSEGQKALLDVGSSPIDPAQSQIAKYEPTIPPMEDILSNNSYEAEWKSIVSGS
jgi:iron(III) transport system substrate-binding protein